MQTISTYLKCFVLTAILFFITQSGWVHAACLSGAAVTPLDLPFNEEGITINAPVKGALPNNPTPNAQDCTTPTLSVVVTNQSCSNVNDGAIDLTITGGGPATYVSRCRIYRSPIILLFKFLTSGVTKSEIYKF